MGGGEERWGEGGGKIINEGKRNFTRSRTILQAIARGHPVRSVFEWGSCRRGISGPPIVSDKVDKRRRDDTEASRWKPEEKGKRNSLRPVEEA